MEIYIDESGLFVKSNTSGSYSVVAAFAVPDKAVGVMELVLGIAKELLGNTDGSEIKLKHFLGNEKGYFRFLANIYRLGGLVCATASDSSLNPPSSVLAHQRTQVSKVSELVGKMRHERGRESVITTAAQLAKLSPQLYTQLYCQVELMRDLVDRSVNYFAQRQPDALGSFKWRIDRSGAPHSAYEDAFQRMAPTLLQTMSFTSPLSKVRSSKFDYSYLDAFEIPIPSYLKDDYGIEVEGGRALDLERVIRGDMAFVNSAEWAGVQVVDLIVSGIRRCLMGKFQDNETAAAHLGSLMVQTPNNGIPLSLVCFRKDRPYLDARTARLVNIMRMNAKRMVR